jgi:hypothetical protein
LHNRQEQHLRNNTQLKFSLLTDSQRLFIAHGGHHPSFTIPGMPWVILELFMLLVVVKASLV